MKTNRIKRFAAFATAACLAFSLTACSDKGKNTSTSSEAAENSSSAAGQEQSQGGGNSGNSDSSLSNEDAQMKVSDKVKDKDLDDSYDDPDAVITLSGDSASVSGSGAEYKNGEIVISKKGTYVFSGTLSDGRIVVDTDSEKADVKIVLKDAQITSSDGCAIYGKSADRVIITLPEGSISTLSDAQTYAQSVGDEEDDTPNACVYADCDLTINGKGSLTVNGNYNNGIVSKDDLVLVNGSVSVNSVNNGFKGKDSITVCDGEYTVVSGGDSLKSDNENDSEKGWIVINGGSFDLVCGGDGIQAETMLTITDGTINVTSQSSAGSDSAQKGIKAGSDLYISGGSFELSTAETCIKGSGPLLIGGGSFVCSAADGKGISAEGNVKINDGDISITKSSEGVESKAVLTINGGDIHIKASDDGLNAGNSSDNAQADHEIFINGGYLYVDANGDGIDSNGDITITGGTIVVAGPTSSADGPLDCGDWGNTITVSGGTLIAVGATGMMEVPDSESTQYSIYTTMLGASQGETVTLADESGSVIVSYTVPKQAQGIVISSPDIESGSTYCLYTGGELSASANDDGLILEGSISGGELVSSGEVTEITTSFGGSVGQGGFGGGGFGGGMGGQGGGKGGRDGNKFDGAAMPDGEMPEMELPDGGMPQGDMPDGDISDMMPSDGERPVMELPDGEMPDSDFKGGGGFGGQRGGQSIETSNS